jgi:hypothetical protein
VLDVADPAHPIQLGALDVGDWPVALAVSGGLAYVVTELGKLVIMDVSDPTASPERWSVEGLVDCVDVAIGSGVAYVAEQAGGLVSVDVRAPARPVVLARVAAFQSQSGLALSWPYAWLAGSGGVQAFDVSTPEAPRALAGVGFRSARAIAVTGGRAVVALGTAGLALLDVGDLSGGPAYVERAGKGDVTALTAAGELTYAAQGADGLTVYRTLPGQLPKEVGAYREGPVNDLAIAGDVAYAAAGLAGLQVLSLADPSRPRRLAVAAEFADARRVLAAGKRAYVLEAEGAGISIFDVADPLVPRRIGSIAVEAKAFALLDAVDTLVLLTDEGRPMTVDVGGQGPDFPVQSVVWSHRAEDVVASGSTAWLLVHRESLRALDFSDPGAPRPRGVLMTPWGGQRLGLAPGQLAVPGRDCDTHLVDVNDPDDPRIVARVGGIAGGIFGCRGSGLVSPLLPAGDGLWVTVPGAGLWYASPAQPGSIYLPAVHRTETAP